MIINSIVASSGISNSKIPSLESLAKINPIKNSLLAAASEPPKFETLLNGALIRESSPSEPLKILETHVSRGLKRIINLNTDKMTVESLTEQVSSKDFDIRRSYISLADTLNLSRSALNELKSNYSLDNILLSKEEISSGGNLYLREAREYSLGSNQKVYLKTQNIGDGLIKINYLKRPSGDARTIEINLDGEKKHYLINSTEEFKEKNILDTPQYSLSVKYPNTAETVNIEDLHLSNGLKISFAKAGEIFIHKDDRLMTEYSVNGDRIDYNPSTEKIISVALNDGSLLKINNNLPTQKIKANTTVINYDEDKKTFFTGPGLKYGAYDKDGMLKLD